MEIHMFFLIFVGLTISSIAGRGERSVLFDHLLSPLSGSLLYCPYPGLTCKTVLTTKSVTSVITVQLFRKSMQALQYVNLKHSTP